MWIAKSIGCTNKHYQIIEINDLASIISKSKILSGSLKQWKPQIGITLEQRETDNINQMVTITS